MLRNLFLALTDSQNYDTNCIINVCLSSWLLSNTIFDSNKTIFPLDFKINKLFFLCGKLINIQYKTFNNNNNSKNINNNNNLFIVV